jgi:hypothetical protein
MERFEERARNEIARCIGEIRQAIDALETSAPIDDEIMRELMQIVDDIEGHVRSVTDTRIRSVPD